MLTLETSRLRLRRWQESDRDSFAEMNAHPEVMHDYGGPVSRSDSDAKFDRYAAAFQLHGSGRWLVETMAGEYLGYCGVMKGYAGHPLGQHHEIGWRLIRQAWGYGYATEAARASLKDFFQRTDLEEVLSYTTAENARSQSVMKKLDLERDPTLDFVAQNEWIGEWTGLVWVARAPSRQSR